MWDLTKIGEDHKITEDQLRSDAYHNFVWKLIIFANDIKYTDIQKDDLQLYLKDNDDNNSDINLLREERSELQNAAVKQQNEVYKVELLEEIAVLKEMVHRQNNAMTQVELLKKEIDILKCALEKNEYEINECKADKIEVKSAVKQEIKISKNSMEETKLATQTETEVFQQEIELIKSNTQQQKELLQMQVDENKSQVQENMLIKDVKKRKIEEITDEEGDVKRQVECLTVQKLNNDTNEINKEMGTMKKDIEDLIKEVKQLEEFKTEITPKVNATETLVRSLKEEQSALKEELEEYFDNEFSRVMKLAPVIPGLDKVVLEACNTENWENCKSFLRQNLPENCASYQQLLKVKDNVLLCAVKYDYEELIAVILKNGFPINKPVVKEPCQTLCHIATKFGNKRMVKFLISQGADIEARNKNGLTPLHYASYWGHVNVVNLLLQKGALINVKTDCNYTPLHYAAQYSHLSVIELLNLHSCDKEIEDEDGDTAYDNFIQYSRSNIEELLKPDLNTV